MNSYVYKFVWVDKDKKQQTKYVDAPSEVDAKIIFKEWFGFEPKVPSVIITRLTGAEN
jgi:hypothetical protein